MGIISWIIIGALAGWLASIITGNNKNMGAGKNILVGIVGAFIGGFLLNLVGGIGITGFNLWSLFVSVIGSVILLVIINALTNKSKI
ncbi:GlsB/YeaQ/YmgE family stress response membrane protein [Anaerosacchariphilus polymeriproducens]|uniref:GlsB/YeaQ/YmgE family stress response membrane protein n=1 Tax=Anaerosacchariphilus polymeriproducens TaxID=1812858 RepID=A0A371AZ93_9FIRM|nr:GlsB/YeaQ/YmgE family stress response membrane protein [Anaerosacchariphilus polymeriproducens]RDU24800.1 GlsB/YeaQ/YmgE family stress response membrane protein [Anaerosacchariphilus polymeriproducens]